MNQNSVAQIRAKSQQKDKAKREERIVCLKGMMQAMTPFFEFSLPAADFKSMYETDFTKMSDEKLTGILRGLCGVYQELKEDVKSKKIFVSNNSPRSTELNSKLYLQNMDHQNKVALLDALQRKEITVEDFREAMAAGEDVVNMDLSGRAVTKEWLDEMKAKNDEQSSRHKLLPKKFWITLNLNA